MIKQKSSKGSRSGRKPRKAALGNDYFTQAVGQPVQKIKGPIPSKKEVKYTDTSQASYVANTTGTITLINGSAQGDDNTSRSGRMTKMLSVAVDGWASVTDATGTLQQQRILIVWDNAPNGAQPTISTILTAANPSAFPNIDYVARFTILKDLKMVFGATTAAFSADPIKQFQLAVKLNSNTRFQGTSAAIASIQDGAVYVITLGSNGAGVTAGQMTYSARVAWIDEE
jgi:hypothetical protein